MNLNKRILTVNVGSPHDTGKWDALETLVDPMAGNYWSMVESFDTEEKAKAFVIEQENLPVAQWTDESVYAVYHRDDPSTLPTPIVEAISRHKSNSY
jgi:Ni2+-binding GTPase involved in maturation of urease and hydrogenase